MAITGLIQVDRLTFEYSEGRLRLSCPGQTKKKKQSVPRALPENFCQGQDPVYPVRPPSSRLTFQVQRDDFVVRPPILQTTPSLTFAICLS